MTYKPPVPPVSLLNFINAHKRFIVAGHEEPDGDCVGSQLALCSAFSRLGKEAIPCQAGPFKRHETKSYEKRFSSTVSDEMLQGAALILVDCSCIERCGDSIKERYLGLPVAVIDHHTTGNPEKNAVYYIDGNAPAAVLLVYSVIKALKLPITKDDAELLFLGLCTDSGFFRHLGEGSAETFTMAAELVRSGANPKGTFSVISGGKTLNSRLLIGSILSVTESYFGGRLLFSKEELADTERFGHEGRDSDTIYGLLMSVKDVEAVAIVRQESITRCTIGLRSRDTVDVSKIAASFGGGGHKNAAGAIVDGTIDSIKKEIIGRFSGIFTDHDI